MKLILAQDDGTVVDIWQSDDDEDVFLELADSPNVAEATRERILNDIADRRDER